jgi:hypothetical protein
MEPQVPQLLPLQLERAKGFTTQTINGTVNLPITFPGGGAQLVGIAVVSTATTQTLNFTVNNDVVIDSVNVAAFQRTAANPAQYYRFFRPLSGSDTLTMRITDTGANSFTMVAYYRSAM